MKYDEEEAMKCHVIQDLLPVITCVYGNASLLFSLSIRSCTDYQIFTSKREKLELHPKM
jgi:hypothetical protein